MSGIRMTSTDGKIELLDDHMCGTCCCLRPVPLDKQCGDKRTDDQRERPHESVTKRGAQRGNHLARHTGGNDVTSSMQGRRTLTRWHRRRQLMRKHYRQ